MAGYDGLYNDFSKYASFNDIPCGTGETLMPVVVDDDFKAYLKMQGLKRCNIRTWHYGNGKTVPVAFIPVKINEKKTAMICYKKQVNRYLKRFEATKWDKLESLDELLDADRDEDRKSVDPTATTENEDLFFLEKTFQLLLEKLNELNPNYGKIISLLAAGYTKSEVLGRINLGTKKSQGYVFIQKAQKKAKEIWEKDL